MIPFTEKESIFSNLDTLKLRLDNFIAEFRPSDKLPCSLVSIIDNINSNTKWERIGVVSKRLLIFLYAENQGFYSFTLLFSYGFVERDKAGNLTDFVRRRLNANLRFALGYIPEYSFVLERSRKDNWHMHGVIQIAQAQIDKVRRTLKRTTFGKNYRQANINHFITDIKPLTTSERWFGYCIKNKSLSQIKQYAYCSRLLSNNTKGAFSNIF